jgi:hypothetical protein
MGTTTAGKSSRFLIARGEQIRNIYIGGILEEEILMMRMTF